MKLTIAEVEKVANLAKLALTQEEKEKFTEQISSILEYVSQLQEVDTSKVAPIAQITNLESVTRPDVIVACDPEKIKALIDQAPATENNLIKAKAVFE